MHLVASSLNLRRIYFAAKKVNSQNVTYILLDVMSMIGKCAWSSCTDSAKKKKKKRLGAPVANFGLHEQQNEVLYDNCDCVI